MDKLRNEHKVPLGELRRVESELEKMGLSDWTSKKLWVQNRHVVFKEPKSNKLREVTTKQFVVEIPLEIVTTSARNDIRAMNKRTDDQQGEIIKKRQLMSSQQVFSGTRIPLSAIKGYINAGYSDQDILADFPSLTRKDIAHARLEAA